MKTANCSDRRRFPRYNLSMPVKFSGFGNVHEDIFKATSINMSMNGIYCTVNHYIPLLDRLQITFIVPEDDEGSDGAVIRVEGVVVRVEPETEETGRTEYKVALYFQDLTPTQQEVLCDILAKYAEAEALQATSETMS